MKLNFTLLLILLSHLSFSQITVKDREDEKFRDFLNLSFEPFNNDFTSIFPPEVIKAKGITNANAEIYFNSRDYNHLFELISEPIFMTKYHYGSAFNNIGYIENISLLFEKSELYSYNYSYNSNGDISIKECHCFDTTKTNPFCYNNELFKYSYEGENIKKIENYYTATKNINHVKYFIKHTIFEYGRSNNLISIAEYKNTHKTDGAITEDESISKFTMIDYFDQQQIAVHRITTGPPWHPLFFLRAIKYNEDGKIILDESKDVLKTSRKIIKKYEYNNQNKLVRYECERPFFDGKFDIVYYYDKDNLLKWILACSDDYFSVINFKYNK